MKQKWFEIEGNKITMFPNEIWKIAGFAFAILFPVCWLAFLAWAGLFQWFFILYMSVGNTIILLPFFYAGSRQIIIDGNTQTVLRKSWSGRSKACSFSEVADVQLVSVAVRYNRNNHYYKLTLVKNPYGRGIHLNTAIGKATPQFATLESTAIPFIKRLLATDTNYANPGKKNWIETEAGGFKMFHQKDGIFTSKPVKIINLIVAIILLGLGFFAMLPSLTNGEWKKEFYWVFILFAAVVNIGL